jgi:hypothetical protein
MVGGKQQKTRLSIEAALRFRRNFHSWKFLHIFPKVTYQMEKIGTIFSRIKSLRDLIVHWSQKNQGHWLLYQIA